MMAVAAAIQLVRAEGLDDSVKIEVMTVHCARLLASVCRILLWSDIWCMALLEVFAENANHQRRSFRSHRRRAVIVL